MPKMQSFRYFFLVVLAIVLASGINGQDVTMFPPAVSTTPAPLGSQLQCMDSSVGQVITCPVGYECFSLLDIKGCMQQIVCRDQENIMTSSDLSVQLECCAKNRCNTSPASRVAVPAGWLFGAIAALFYFGKYF